MNSKIQVGDLTASGPVPGKEEMLHKGIQAMGSFHTHDELIGEVDGIKVVGNAHSPHFTLDPFQSRVEEFMKGDRVMAVFRWHDNLLVNSKEFKDGVNACLKLMAELEVPYDNKAIRSHARNYIRKKLKYFKFLGPVTSHVEYKVFCTENCFITYLVNGLDLNNYIGNQPLVAPVHVEKLYKSGLLKVVEDYGLIRYLS